MNKSLLLISIFCCQIAFANCPYQSQMKFLWEKLSYERKIDSKKGYLPANIKEFLHSTRQHAKKGERVLIAFYPKECGFDHLATETSRFVELGDFIQEVDKAGFKIIYCLPRRHLACFEGKEQIDLFLKNTFATHLNRENPPTKFFSKLVIAELEKK